MTLPAQREDRASPCDTETRVNPAQLAALGKKNGGKKGGRTRWRESRESNLEGLSGDIEQCGGAWSLNSCGWGKLSLLGESDPEEQRLGGHVERVTKGQEMQTFSEGGKTLKPLSGRFWSFTAQPCRRASKRHSSQNRDDNFWSL